MRDPHAVAAHRHQATRFVTGIAIVAWIMLSSHDAEAQIISPGKLSAPHGSLDGIRNCTSCHQLRSRGIVNAKCLECHQPIGNRIAAATGLHATYPTQTCANCHKEHGGRELDILRFDSTGFDHDDAGFTLRGSHEQKTCRTCHTAELVHDSFVRQVKGEAGALSRTFLGLGRECVSCHTQDDPHAGQFAGTTCESCHNEQRWSETPGFDHSATRYPLTGLHRGVACGDCHGAARTSDRATYVRYTPLSFQSCASCHQDQHRGTMGTRCTECHSTGGWTRVDRVRVENRFDHSTTGFLFVGQHESASCASCHQFPPSRTASLRITMVRGTEARTFPTPIATNCISCHVDYHEDTFANAPGGVTCDNCHNQDHWWPASYDLARHNRDAAFVLTGAHASVPCTGCHQSNPDLPTLTFRIEQQTCESCHLSDDPHQSQFFDRTCDTCHDTRAFHIDDFDHSATTFPLDRAHEAVPCRSCHREQPGTSGKTFIRYTPLLTSCKDCHG